MFIMKTKLLLATVALFTTFSLSAQEAKYEFKSAIIKKSMEMWGQKIEAVQYFDDYGKMESVSMTMQIQGTNTRMRTITVGDVITVLNLENKTGNRVTMSDNQVNFLKLTQEVKDKYKVKELGEETIAGKPCKKYSMEMSQMGQDVSITTWIWKGIALKTISEAGGMTIIDLATDIKENVAVDAENFSIPSDFSIQDM